jgi:signal transduction histidine kinase
VALQLKRAIPSTGFVIAIADDESGRFEIAHRQGYAAYTPEEIELRLTRAWLDALATSNVVREATPNGLEITAPLVSAEGVLGALTLYAEPLESESAIEETERVLAVIAAQTAVAAGVAHELRNPLFGISSAAQLLRFRAREDPVVEKNVGRILREVERLNKMVTSLLEFGRPNAVHLQPADPEVVWDDILEGERARLDAQRLTIRRTRPALPVRSMLDPEQLGQVFRNILVNACDAAPEGSELVLASQVSPVGGWRCRLTNGGPSIPAEVLPHVFEFFYSTKAGGTGIGLALCQRIMDEHGGTINIDSQPEQGTTLTLTLPATAAT